MPYNKLTAKASQREASRRYRLRHPEKVREYKRTYNSENADKIAIQSAKWRALNREKVNEGKRKWSKANIASCRKRHKRWRDKNRQHVRAYAKGYWKRRFQSDVNSAISYRLRSRIKQAVKHNKNEKSAYRTMSLLGCSIPNFKIYIESKFEVGMSWENWGYGRDKWNLDHIVPCALFDLTKQSHQKRCFHFSNYQPMWQPENFKKGSRVANPQLRLI
jgi:hypothetical protein